MINFILFLAAAALPCTSFTTLKIGAVFESNNMNTLLRREAVHFALEKFNSDRASLNKYKIEPVIEEIASDDVLSAITSTCSLLEKGVVGIIGPSSQHNSRMVQSICDHKDIPFLDVRWLDEPNGSTINFYPSQNTLTQMYIDVITAWEFTNFVVLYEDYESFKRVNRLVQHFDKEDHKIVLRQLDASSSGNYRPLWKELSKSGATHFVLDCSIDILQEVLNQALQVGLMTSRHYFFVTNFDLQTLDLTWFQHAETNITGVRIFDPYSTDIQELANEVFKDRIADDPSLSYSAASKLPLESVLLVDAVTVFGQVVKDLRKNLTSIPMNCSSSNDVWVGSTITNLVKGSQFSGGYSGTIGFDGKGYRNSFTVDVIELREGGITQVGNWSDEKKLSINRIFETIEDEHKKTLKDKTFRVVISLIEPFAMYTPTEGGLEGNSRYQGFAVDLIHELSLIEGFSYVLINQKDKKNGDFNATLNKWEGMIGAIREDRADLAIADLTITRDRQNAVDFTTPFMNLGISILYQKPKKAPPSFFSFADPFALEVWILLGFSFFAVSIVLFILGRICSSEWCNPYPCIEEPEFLVNQLSLRNCFWFVSGSIMQQGTEIGPIAVSTRLVAVIWWFFALIMVSSYTANLAAFLTNESPDPHFKNVYELVANAEKKGIKWGAKKGGSTVNFFNGARAQIPEYGQIYDYMIQHENEALVSDPVLGVERSERENYAFFMEITSIEYEIQRRCNLMAVGNLLDEKSYGIAMKTNSSYRNVLSRAILHLQDTGKLNDLKRKWWEEKRGGGYCAGEDDSQKATALNLKNVGGIFWMTIGGALVTILLVVIELILHTIKKTFKSRINMTNVLKDEFKFYFKLSRTVKPVNYDRNDDEGEKASQE